MIAAESFNFNRQPTDPLLQNPAAAAEFEIVGGHIYGSGLADYPLVVADARRAEGDHVRQSALTPRRVERRARRRRGQRPMIRSPAVGQHSPGAPGPWLRGSWLEARHARAAVLAGEVMLLFAGAGCASVAEPVCKGDPDGERPLACCSQGPVLQVGGLPPRPFHSYESQAQTVAEWRAFCEYDTGVSHGECENGLRFVVMSNGLATEYRYFDATGAFVAVEGYVDLIDEVCLGRWYWPEPIDCSEKKWGAIICTPPPQL